VDEPSVLDYLTHLLKNWRRLPELIQAQRQHTPIEPPVSPLPGKTPPPVENIAVEPSTQSASLSIAAPAAAAEKKTAARLPSNSIAVLFMALLAQLLLEPPLPDTSFALLLYTLAALLLLNAVWRNELALADFPSIDEPLPLFRVHRFSLILGFVFGSLAFLAFGGGDFNGLNLTLWSAAILCTVNAFVPLRHWGWGKLWQSLTKLRQPQWTIRLSRWSVLLALASLVILFFRFYRLAEVPPEMVSDHAEKLLDVGDVLSGQWHIFFPRNTGREAFQMFLTAAVTKWFGTGLSFLSLKLGTALAGLLIFPYLYLLGKEIANKRVGFFAMFLAGVSYWLNVITRVALRFSLYPLFVAPTLYHLIRGLRKPNLKDFVLAGFFLGFGLHGYSPFRIVPLVVLVAVGLALIHRSTPPTRRAMLIGLIVIVIVSLMVFLPLFRYAIQHPDQFSYRALTRISDLEKPLDKPAWQIFLNNLWRAMIMFFWDNHGVWVVSIPGRPALGVVPAALLLLGIVLILSRYLRQRNWVDLFLFLSIPLLMLPSILSLAFPDENPILNRTSGAIIPVFLLIALALDALVTSLEKPHYTWLKPASGWIVAVFLLTIAAAQDYDLTFHQYQQLYKNSAWNTSEMGDIIHNFATTIGNPDSAWVVAYPYWVDTRLVGINAGYPSKDYAIWPDQFGETLSVSGPKLFLLNPQDGEGLEKLRQMFPAGSLQIHPSPLEGKTFYIFFVPPSQSQP
jgi:hypothetical protein